MKKETLNKLPISPGVYIFKDKDGGVLYIGKAGKLRSRVRSYFLRGSDLSDFKKMMVEKISDIETIITSDENEALILEAVLIKKHKPPYNITLKDDKNYQYVKIDWRFSEPIVTTVRRPEEDRGRSQARYFGPYTSGLQLKENLRLLRRIFPWRKKPGKRTRFEEELLAKRSVGPLPESEDEYKAMIKNFMRVLEGRSEDVIKILREKMREYSAAKGYEKAALLRNQITALRQIDSRQKIISVKGESQDVISIYRPEPPPTPSLDKEGVKNEAAANVFVIRAGKLIDKLNFLLQNVAGESPEKILQAFLLQYYQEAANVPKEIIIPVSAGLSAQDLRTLLFQPSPSPPPWKGGGKYILPPPSRGRAGVRVELTVPHHGKKRDLIKLGEENARDYLEKHLASWQKQNNDEALLELKEKLGLPSLPARIEGYDISNIQGKMAVGSMVVFTDGLADKKEYRKFKIKTIKGADDFKMLAEVLLRRFTKEEWPIPDLVLLDGGKGQLSVTLQTLFPVILEARGRRTRADRISRINHGRLQGDLQAYQFIDTAKPPLSPLLTKEGMGVVANQFIAITKKQEEVFQGAISPRGVVETRAVASLRASSAGSYLLQRVRDEAHRFAQSYFHVLQSKGSQKSRLDEIPGVGPKTKKIILQKFGSLAGIRQAGKDDIIKLIGEKKARLLLENI